jgi:hypothetical protein
MTIINEREIERKSGSSVCWLRDTEKYLSLIKKRKKMNTEQNY